MVLTHRDPLPYLAGRENKGKLVPEMEPRALTALGGLGFVGAENPWKSGKTQILIGRSGWSMKRGISSKFPGYCKAWNTPSEATHSVLGMDIWVVVQS